MAISIVLADDHVVVRDGLRRLLEEQEGLRVVGETGDGLEVVDLVVKLRPKVLLLDIMLPGLNGAEVARQVRKRAPMTGILMLSMHADESYVLSSLRNGARGYVVKSARPEELVEAVRAVAVGRHFLSSEVADRAALLYARQAKKLPPDPFDTLTTRERQVLHLLAEGLSYAAAAERLGVSARTVETHRTNLARKLDLSTPTELARYAIRRGLVSA